MLAAFSGERRLELCERCHGLPSTPEFDIINRCLVSFVFVTSVTRIYQRERIDAVMTMA
jgi:hypothetical protein